MLEASIQSMSKDLIKATEGLESAVIQGRVAGVQLLFEKHPGLWQLTSNKFKHPELWKLTKGSGCCF